MVDADEEEELSAEEKAASAEKEAEAAHYRYWQRLTRSSGAPIPPYKPRETQ